MEPGDLLRQPERWARVVSWATVAGLEFGLIGPFGSYASNVFTRIAYWTGLFWTGSLLLWPAVVVAFLLAPRRGFPPFFATVATVLIVCVPLAMLGALGTHLLWPARAASMKVMEWYGLTLLVALPATAALVWLELGRGNLRRLLAQVSGAAEDHARQAGAATTVPDHLLATALCLQMEDHHVRVHLAGRSLLHFGVLRDVVATLDEGRGLQVHRSWWVSRDAVRGWCKEDRSVALLLSNGLKVPVARNRVALLRAEGWLEGVELQPAAG